MHALVTGGNGLIGRRLVAFLCGGGHHVRILARRPWAAAAELGAEGFVGDICDDEAVRRAVDGVDTVFHLAAKVGTWGALDAFMAVNRDATAGLVAAARAAGVTRFIHASTPSVVGYDNDVENGAADLPHAARHLSPYAASKAAGEAVVLAANTPELATTALRPHLVIGPGDMLTVRKLIDGARAGTLRIVGNGRNRVDVTYSDNAAWAFVDAARALTDWRAPCAGKAYFIGNGAPVQIWPFMDSILADCGLPPIKRRVPLALALGLGGVMETLWRILDLQGEPPITRFMANGLARHHWYDPAPARADLDYQPRVSIDEAQQRIVAWVRDQMDVK